MYMFEKLKLKKKFEINIMWPIDIEITNSRTNRIDESKINSPLLNFHRLKMSTGTSDFSSGTVFLPRTVKKYP